MKDYLKELCEDLGIELVYTDDDYTALSSEIKGKRAIIRVDTVFKGCPEKVAKAAIGYYTESGREDDYLKVIKNYILDNVITVEYTVVPPDETFRGLFIKHMDDNDMAAPEVKVLKTKAAGSKTSKSKTAGSKTAKSKSTRTSKAKNDTSSLVEANISSIVRKSFYGGTQKMKPNQSIKPSSDDVIELDIEVDDPGK